MFTNIEEVQLWCSKILPTVFDDSLSYLESVYRLKSIVNELIKAVNILGESNNELRKEYEKVLIKLDEMEKWMDDYLSGCKIPDGSISLEKLSDDVIEMIQNLVVCTVRDVAKFVMFELDDEGYFNAIIPDSWDHIEFDTDENGNLILEY